MKLLRGKNALLTGGSRGIGPVIARILAQQGVNLALVARSADRLETVAQTLSRFNIRVISVPADLTDTIEVEALFQRVEAELGPVDILINNAAVEQVSHFAHLSPAELQTLVVTNLTAPLLLTRFALPGMLARRSGHIVNIAFDCGQKSAPLQRRIWRNQSRPDRVVRCAAGRTGRNRGRGFGGLSGFH